MQVRLGNIAPHVIPEAAPGEPPSEPIPHPLPEGDDHAVTSVHFPEGLTVWEAVQTVTNANGVWAYHSAEAPAWVSSDDDALALLLSAALGCPVHEWSE